MIKNDIIKNLVKFDQELQVYFFDKKFDKKIDIVIIGATYLVLKNFLDRRTKDIDVGVLLEKKQIISFEHNIEKIANKYDINTNAVPFLNGICEFQEEWKEHKLENVKFKCIKIFLPSLEIFIITKINSSIDRANDLEDILKINIKKEVDLEKVKFLCEEWCSYIASDRSRKQFIHNYKSWLKDLNEL